MTPARRVALVALTVALAVAGFAVDASAGSPAITLSQSAAALGDRVRVQLHDWPAGPVVLSICGNNALRGDQDCALQANEAVSNTGAETLFDLPVVSPPASCPCVVRAFNAGNAIVRTAPLEIAGVPVGPTVAAEPGALQELEVIARITSSRQGGLDGLRAALGGPATRTLVIRIRNAGSVVVSGLTLSAGVGRGGQGGEPLSVPEVASLAPGEEATYDVPFTLSAPVWGRYVAVGTVYGQGPPVSFTAVTRTTPWLLVFLVVVLASATALYIVVRYRRRARIRRALREHHRQLTSRQTMAEHPQIRADSRVSGKT